MEELTEEEQKWWNEMDDETRLKFIKIGFKYKHLVEEV